MKSRKNISKEAIVLLIAVGMALSTFVATGSSLDTSVNITFGLMRAGNTLIVDTFNDRIIEVDSSGTTVWSFSTGLSDPMDVERLSNGNTLISDTWNNRVIEVDHSGTIIWSISSGLLVTFDAERLTNGNTLITDNNHHRVIEVDSSGTTIWQKTGLQNPTDAERLSNGNTLITDCLNNRIIEVDSSSSIVWSYSIGLNHPTDAERLSNGNTLIAGNNNNNVIEVDSSGSIVWSYSSGLDHPHDAERLSNSNTLISDAYNNRIIEVDSSGTTVWSYSSGLDTPFDAERLVNQPPNAPTITGETNGKAGTEYEYTFNAVDPDGDNAKYHIDWDDGDSDTTDFSPSGTDVKVKHTWSNEGTYTIKAKAEDTNGLVGPEGSLSVTMPRNRAINRPFQWFLQQHPNLFPILQRLLQRLGLQ